MIKLKVDFLATLKEWLLYALNFFKSFQKRYERKQQRETHSSGYFNNNLTFFSLYLTLK